jgi:hypothetical protein
VKWILGGALCLLLALATLPRTAWSARALPEQVPAATAPAAATAQPTPRARCVRCGVVERIRVLEPVGTLPAEYEMTVRLRDGSASVSTVAATTAAVFAVGAPIQLVGGL